MAADRFGRKVVFQSSMIFWGFGSLWCSLAPDAPSLGYARLLLGFGMGMEFPVALAIVCEMIPAPRRGRYSAMLEGFWPIGFIAAGLLSLLILSYWSWREVFLLQAIPAVFVFVVRRYVPESPRWLAERGRVDGGDRPLKAGRSPGLPSRHDESGTRAKLVSPGPDNGSLISFLD